MTVTRDHQRFEQARRRGYDTVDAMDRADARVDRLVRLGQGVLFYAMLFFVVWAIGWMIISGAFDKPARGQDIPFATGQRLANFRALMPLPEYADDERVFYFTDRDMPRAYQFSGGFHSPYYNIAANPDPFGNANREYPWDKAGGMHNVPESLAYGVKFLRLPLDASGNPMPIVWWFDPSMGIYRWRFPRGSEVGEMLVMKCPDGRDRTFEVRVRNRDERSWQPQVYRPAMSPQQLANAIKRLRPNWQNGLAAAVAELESPPVAQLMKFADTNHDRPAVTLTFKRAIPPELPADLAGEILDRTRFRDVSGVTEDTRSPAPHGYAGYTIGTEAADCRKCHETVGMLADYFDADREWYGRVRGSDGIFSFHGVRRQSISGNGASFAPAMHAIAGVYERRDDSRHDPADYQQLER